MSKLTLNSISPSLFSMRTIAGEREEIVAKGQMLFFEHALKGKEQLFKANGENGTVQRTLSDTGYKQLNEQFQHDHMLYAAKVACAQSGETAPADWDSFKRQGMKYYGNAAFYRVLQGIYQEVIIPILPSVYSEAIGMFADMVEVNFGETYTVSVGSNDIPIFQDSSWGASRSVPRNRFYTKDYTLNPQPKTCMISAKWIQMVGNGQDFGQFFANMAAGMYAKTMGMWNAALMAATSDTTKIPSNLNYTFSNVNWNTAAQKIAALNNTRISNVFATGSNVALGKVLPTQVTGATNVNMDAAIATLLGADYTRSGYLGVFNGVRLTPMQDVIIPGTQNTAPAGMLSATDVWMMAGNGRKPMTIGYTSETPITIEIDPTKSADFEIGMNLTIALDTVAIFSSKLAHFTV